MVCGTLCGYFLSGLEKTAAGQLGLPLPALKKKSDNQMMPVLPLLDNQITMVASNVFLLDWSERERTLRSWTFLLIDRKELSIALHDLPFLAVNAYNLQFMPASSRIENENFELKKICVKSLHRRTITKDQNGRDGCYFADQKHRTAKQTMYCFVLSSEGRRTT